MITTFKNTAAAAAFIGTADSRETSVEILRAITHIARNVDEAERIWEAPTEDELVAVIEITTGNGREDAADFCWGEAGSQWADA